MLLVVIFGGETVVIFLILVINYIFFSYSNFLYKMGGIKVLIKWVFMGYFVLRLPCERV